MVVCKPAFIVKTFINTTMTIRQFPTLYWYFRVGRIYILYLNFTIFFVIVFDNPRRQKLIIARGIGNLFITNVMRWDIIASFLLVYFIRNVYCILWVVFFSSISVAIISSSSSALSSSYFIVRWLMYVASDVLYIFFISIFIA